MKLLIFIITILVATPTTIFATENNKLRIAMTAAFVSESGVNIYQDIANYLTTTTGYSTEFYSGLSYSTVNKMLLDGAIDIAFVCGYPYVLSENHASQNQIGLLAAPVMQGKLYQGKPIYFSYIIVPKTSTIKNFIELAGKRFVYNDKTSNSGYNMPRAKLIQMQQTQGFFSEVIHSGSHEESIRMVAAGKADASAVDSLVLDYARLTGEEYAHEVTIIETLGPAAIPPIVYSTQLAKKTVTQIQQAFLDMHKNQTGMTILNRAFLKKFTLISDKDFNGIRDMHDLAQEKNFLQIK